MNHLPPRSPSPPRPRPTVSTSPSGRVLKRLAFFNAGALVALLGLAVVIGSTVYSYLFVPRLLLAFSLLAGGGVGVLLIIGGLVLERMLIRYVCSECENRVESRSKICPTCRCLLGHHSTGFSNVMYGLASAAVLGGLLYLILHKP
jgi:hypothetical protein